ncbi:MAG: FtsW/RodA/SpoVE family cell cycle protein [Erysipelothrix sp.]|nr:FtsW/RodA/SpoVE family cell cycle protein [Erysipelothrix sp.]
MKRFLNIFRIKKGSDMIIHTIVILLALFGIVMAVSASMSDTEIHIKSLIFESIKQLVFFLIGYMMMVFASKLYDENLIKKIIMPVSIMMIFFLISTLFFPEVNGAKAWIRLKAGSVAFTLQPSEFAKVGMILLVAYFLGDISRNSRRTTWMMIEPIVFILMAQVFVIIFLQKDFGSALVLMLIAFIVALIPSHPRLRRLQYVAMVTVVFAVGMSIFLLSDFGMSTLEKIPFIQPYQLQRFHDYMNPFKSILGSGYQLSGSLIAFSRGGWRGQGLGQSIQKYGYLPETRTDYILPLIAEELGLIGVSILMLIYAFLLYRLVYYALHVKSEKDKMILIGTTMYLFIHLALNVGGVSGSIPLTGVPLLLISAGGSSMMSILLAIGTAQAIISKYRLENKNAHR